MWWLIGQGLISGILSGGVYALIAVGLSVVFGVMKIVNFAMGEFLTTGMYVAFVGYMLTGYSAYALIPFVIIVMVAVGSVSFTLAIKPLIKRKDPSSFIMVTVGLSFFLINLVQIVFGADYMSIPSAIKSASIAIGDFTVGVPRLIALCVSIVLVVLLTVVMNRTFLGRAMRAAAENAQVSEMLGINTGRTFNIAFTISIVFAGIAGAMLTPLYYVYPSIGSSYNIFAVVAVVMGGMGNIKGALIGGIMLGIIESVVGALVSTDLGQAAIFALFLIVVYFKPQGLFGKKVRVG